MSKELSETTPSLIGGGSSNDTCPPILDDAYMDINPGSDGYDGEMTGP